MSILPVSQPIHLVISDGENMDQKGCWHSFVQTILIHRDLFFHVTDALSIHNIKQDLIFQTSNGNVKSYNETINILRVADFLKSTVFECLNEAVRADMGSYGHETSGDWSSWSFGFSVLLFFTWQWWCLQWLSAAHAVLVFLLFFLLGILMDNGWQCWQLWRTAPRTIPQL